MVVVAFSSSRFNFVDSLPKTEENAEVMLLLLVLFSCCPSAPQHDDEDEVDAVEVDVDEHVEDAEPL